MPKETFTFFLNLARTQAALSRRFDSGLGGLGLTEFMILYSLSKAKDKRLRRTELAAKTGLTASGVTRILLPMEKVGLVKRQDDSQDARVSYVALAPGGQRKLEEGLEDAELLAQNLLRKTNIKDAARFSEFLDNLAI